jgi:hypothetical protein
MAKAHAIAEKDHQRQQQEQGLENDNELSVLATSLFNGMEGIEVGGAELADVEMGGTSNFLTD